MKRSELTGLVLTHGERNPTVTLQQLAKVCEQVVLVQDTRTDCGKVPLENFDDTVDITVVERDFDTFPAQRNAGLDKARGSWVLSVDSDELLSEELATNLAELEPGPDTKAFGIPRQELFHGRTLRARMYCDYHPRMFRSNIRYASSPEVHERFEDFDYGELSFIEAPLIHDITDTLPQLFAKAYDYGRIMQQSGDESDPSLRSIAAVVPDTLVRQQYARDGLIGVGMAAVQISYELGRYQRS